MLEPPQKKILVVEDDLGIADIVEYLLTDQGFSVHCLNRAQGFYEELSSFNPDLILLDIRLPDGNGIDLCKHVKLNPVTNSTPVILMSAHARQEDVLDDARADSFIEKPFDISLFMEEVSRKISRQDLSP